MRVVMLHQYFKTPEEGGGIRSWYLCHALKQAGHDVEVITSWNNPNRKTVSSEGFPVHYLPVYYANNLGVARRIWAFLQFAMAAHKKLSTLAKPDCVYAISTPISIGWLAKRFFHKTAIPYIFEVGDLWPDVPVQMGFVRNKILVYLLKKLELSIYDEAKNIVAMSPAMMDYFETLGQLPKTICVTNFSDLSFFSGHTQPDEVFTVAYTGSLGKANCLTYLIDLAQEAQNRGLANFRCVIMGEGAERALLEAKVREKGLQNVRFLAHDSKEKAMALLQESSMAYLSFAQYNRIWTGSPNKYFDALALGKPVLCNFGGWIGEKITRTGCGIVYQATDPKAFFDQHWESLQTSGRLESMGENALQLAKEKYSIEQQMPRWLSLFSV